MQASPSPQPSSHSTESQTPTAASANTHDVERVVNFSQQTYHTLEELANGGSIADALRDAIAVSKWFNDTIKSGAKILVERKGKLYEVIKIS